MPHGVEEEPPQEHDADAGQEDPRELHAHLEAPDEDVAAAGEDVVEGAERRPPEGHEQRDDPDRHEGASRHGVRQRRTQATMPTPTRMVTTGQRPAS